MDLHFGRTFMVLGFVIALVAGMFSVAGAAISIDPTPTISLVGDQEAAGHPGHGMISIGDTIVVSVDVTIGPVDSILSVIADMRKYGGSQYDTLSTFRGQDAWVSADAWVPECSDGSGSSGMDSLAIWPSAKRNPKIVDATWKIMWAGGGNWWVIRTPADTAATQAATGTLYHLIDTGDTLFTFKITSASGLCGQGTATADHHEFETHAPVAASATYMDTLIVADGGDQWIDDTPCPYTGHSDPRVQVIACADTCATHGPSRCAQCDTMMSEPPGLDSNGEGEPLDYDTHWTKYAQLDDPAGLGAEFIESNDYTFTFNTTNAGNYYDFGTEDRILNPQTVSPDADQVCAFIDMRKLAHENGNDDIDSLYFDLSDLGDAYTDTSIPNINDGKYWFNVNPNYGNITCVGLKGYNGWPADSVLKFCWHIAPGHTDADSGVKYIKMWWISDSGDTTFFPIPTHKLLAIDNIIPAMTDTSLAQPRDTVDYRSITAIADMSIAGNINVLNPASEGYPNPDLVQFKIDLKGLYDLSDVTGGGQVWADMRGIGVWQYNGSDPAPFEEGYFRKMHTMSPIYGTDSVGVVAYDPPHNMNWDTDSITAGIYIFDDAGNAFVVSNDRLQFPIDNVLPIVDPNACLKNNIIYAEVAVDASPYPPAGGVVASVGKPLEEACGGLYNDRDEIRLHANLGDYFPPSEISDVEFITDAYDPFCVGGIKLYDDGTHGSDPVNGDKDFTGHARIEVAHTMRHDTTFCRVDTDLDSLGFDVLVTDNAGNVALNHACHGIRVDNEPPTMTAPNVSIRFWDDPATFGIDGDKNGNGIVDKGDRLLFEWAAENEPWGDGEIDSVWVDASSIDPAWSGIIHLFWDPSGGIYRNCVPSAPCNGYYVNYGTVEDDTISAKFRALDDAGNSTGWCTFKSNLVLDDKRPMIECDSIKIAISGPDTVASVGDTVTFTYSGPDSDVTGIKIDVDDFRYEPPKKVELVKSAGVWTGSFVVMKGHEESDAYSFDVEVTDDVGNHLHCDTPPIAVDNEPPEMNCHDAWLRLYDYVNNVSFRVVNVGDNLTAIYWDDIGDIVRVTADFSSYFGTPTVFDLVKTIQDGPKVMWGYRVDPVPDGTIDEPAGGKDTKVLITAYDEHGNSSSDWFCPIWTTEPGPIPAPPLAAAQGDDTANYTDYYFATHGGLCSAPCVAVDTQRPAPVPDGAITFQLLENSNGIANIGDRLRIIVNMGDPTAPGYDMQWASAAVQADVSQYGFQYSCHDWDDADMSDCSYLFLNDDNMSAGGEGDGRFSYYFWYQAQSGNEMVEGAPILPGRFTAAAGDTLTRIRVRAMDDAGNFSLGWTYSDVLKDTSGNPVPVDNHMPELEPSMVHASYVDADHNGICDIGDTVTVSYDATDVEGGPLKGVYAYLYDWGYPSQDMVPLTLSTLLAGGANVYSITFPVGRNPGDFCWQQPDGDVGFENLSTDNCRKDLKGGGLLHPEVQILLQDDSDNWSWYVNPSAPEGHEFLAQTEATLPVLPQFYPTIQAWPFNWEWPDGVRQDDILADTDDPDPVNPSFWYNSSGIQALKMPGGRIGIYLYYQKDPRNQDVQEFYVYGDVDTPGTIDWTKFLGEPIPAGMVATSGPLDLNRTPDWVSDALPEREQDYHFALLAVDDAKNTSDPALTWVTGTKADTTAPTGYVDVFFGEDESWCTDVGQPTSIGGDSVYVLGHLDQSNEYINVAYAELWARIKDLDPSTEGDQPGQWHVIDQVGQWPPSYPLPTAPYKFGISGIHNDPWFGDLTKCTTFEFALVPWDEAGNHGTADQAAKFVFTYDPFSPVVTTFAINGNPSPENMDLSGSALVEIQATDQCPDNGDLNYALFLKEVGGQWLMSYWGNMLTNVTLHAGEPFTYTWDLANYPAGDATLMLGVCDKSGNWTYHMVTVSVIDQTAPGGVFASMRYYDMYSHPYYTELLDGMSTPARHDQHTWFWVKWPKEVPWPADYDVGQVKLEYGMRGDLSTWTTLGVLTSYADTVSWNGAFYVGYDFIWDASSLHDGDQIDLKATVTDHVGNEQVAQIWLKVAAEAPILTLSIPEAKDVCSEKRVKGDINIVATEKSETNPIDTYYVGYIYKKSTFPDLGDCNAFDDQGWVMCPDTLMIEGHNTSETIWRATMPTSKLADGSYDIALVTIDVAGNYSWDMNRDWCVDAGYFGQCVANGMGMTVVVQNHAPELRIRKVNNFEAVDEGLDWAEPVYVQVGQPVTVTSVAASTCDIAKVDYYLSGEYVIDGWRGPVHVGTSTDAASGYQVTFPPTGGLEQYFEPNAFQNGYAMVDLIAIVTDLLGNVTQEATYAMVPIWVLKVAPSSAFVTQPSPGEYVRSWVNIEGDVLDNEAVYDITYEYRAVGATDWITIAQTKPHCGDPWNKDVNNAIIKWNTDLLADGDYQLRAVSRDANLTVDTNPSVITVHVDNTAPTITAFNLSPTYTVGEALPTAPSTYIGGPHVELSATGSDAGGIDHVHFMYKAIDADIDSATALYRDDEAPYAYDWICGFPQVPSGWYDFIVKIEDKAGNETYQTQRVYVDQYAPFGWIGHISWKKGTQTIDDQTPDNSNFYGVLDINGTCKDDAPASACLDGHNQKFDSGLKAAQFQYQPVTGGGYLGVATGAESQSVPNPNAWIDLGEQVVGTGPDYAINWDTGTLVPGKYYVRIVGIDNVDNRADVDGAPSLPYITINIVDQIAPKAIIAGVDDVSGYIWATADTHGQDDVKFVRFEYRPATATAEWTVIGVVDTTMCKGLYGVPWHFASIGPGNYWVRAVAYDDDYDVVNFPDLYDQNPAMMYVTVTADYKVTMASTSYISSLTRWGSLSDYTEVGVKAVCAAGEPTVIVVFDNDPEDHYNVPRVKLLSLERPDDPAQWVDQFWFGQLGDWGVATIIGTYNNSGTVGAKTSTVKVYRVTDAEGTKGVVSQDSMSVDIPAGVIRSDSEGLLVINTPRPFAQPTLLDVTPVGPAVMMKFLGGGENDDNRIFDNGYRADVTLAYRQGEITSSMVESNLRPAWWDGVNAQWQYSGITNVSVNTSTNVVTFKANHTGTFTVVSATTFRITQPVYYPGCKVGGVTYTSKFPKFASVIEDVINGLNEPEIKVTIDGPAGDKIFDNLTLYYHGDAIWPWIKAEYDEIGHILGIAVDPGYSWGEGDYRWGAGAWNGLPGGQYTLKIEALNAVGDKKSLTDVFTVDAGVPTVDFAGTYVAANPSFTLNVGDALSGVDPATVFLDVYAIRANGYQTENKEYLGTATPSAMSYDGGTVTFGNMTFHETLGDNMSIDVIVYDGHVPSDTGTQVIYNGCTDEDDHQCRSYYSEQGIADCVGNHANPVWRRFTVDATCPTMTLVSKESDQDIEVKVEDDISGIPWNIEGEQTPFDIKVDGEAFYDYTFVPTSNNHVGTLRFTVGAGAAKIEVTARDAVGNFCVLEINKGAEVVDVTDVKSYPNPFDPGSGQYTTISFDLTKKADVLIKIFDFAGEYVTTVADGWYDPGTHTINWFGTDGNGKTVASGAYIGYVKIDDGSKVIARNLKIGVGAKCCSGD